VKHVSSLPPWSIIAVVTGATGLALTISCSSKSPTEPSGSSFSSFVSGAATVGTSPVQGILNTGSPPAPSGGPTAAVTAPSTATNGGANVVSVSGSAPFRKIDVSVSAGSTVAGFLEVDLPAATSSQQITLSFGSAIPSNSFTTQFQVVSASGAVGAVASAPMTVVPSTQATASVAVSLAPNPTPFLADSPCTAGGPIAHCEWQYTITLQEVNGVAVSGASATEIWVFPPPAGPQTFTVVLGPIPARGTFTDLRTLSCSTPPCNLSSGPAGTSSFTWQPTDANGHVLNITGPTETLTGAGGGALVTQGIRFLRPSMIAPGSPGISPVLK
jgi:hypothetical protein